MLSAIEKLKLIHNKMVEVFKTNVQERKAPILLAALSNAFPGCRINFDLEDCDRVLRIEGTDFCNEAIISMLNAHNCICEILE